MADGFSTFRFVDDVRAFADCNALLVWIPAGILRRRELFAVLASGLRFPDYFGWNWDALEECLRDFSWIAAPRRIVLVHASFPFREGSRSRAIYLELLSDAIVNWRDSVEHELWAVFPSSAKEP